MSKRCSLAQAAAEIGADSLIEQLVDGKLKPLGIACRDPGLFIASASPALPQPIPPEHFAIPLREKNDVPDIEWVDPDYDERTGVVMGRILPATCVDPETSTIYTKGWPRWIEITVDQRLAPKSKGGPPEKWDWVAIEKHVFELMDHHGDFLPGDTEWNGIGKLENSIQKRFPGEDKSGPAHGTLHPKLSKMVDRWRGARRVK